MADTIVIGAGLAGLTSAIRLAQAGQSVTLLTKGLGGLPLSQGTVDVLGYAPDRVDRPFEAVARLVEADPAHPYAVIGAGRARQAVDWLRALVPDLLAGDPAINVTLPTAVGARRPTALYQPSMAAGHLPPGQRVAVVGPVQLKDFSPELCAANLARNDVVGDPVVARPYRIDLPARPGEADGSAVAYARSLDTPSFRQRFALAVRDVLGDEAVVGLPAMLGLADKEAWLDLRKQIGRPVFEISLIPPSVPGLRLNEALTAAARAAGVRIVLGSVVVGFVASGGRLQAVVLHQAGHDQAWPAAQFVYAPGGWESGAIQLDSHGRITERLFGLPLRGVTGEDANADLLTGDFWRDQALFKVGVGVDAEMRVVDAAGQPVFANLRAAGSILAGALRWSEKSGEGIALGSAWAAAEAIAKTGTTGKD